MIERVGVGLDVSQMVDGTVLGREDRVMMIED
jgi:hypothetical protein